LAASTRLVSCARVAAAPVGLLGEQKKITSDFSACEQSGVVCETVLYILMQVVGSSSRVLSAQHHRTRKFADMTTTMLASDNAAALKPN